MVLVLAFAVTLLLAVLVSELADRSILSTAVLFLVAGILIGDGVFAITTIKPDDPLVIGLASLALFCVLFTDGMHVTATDLTSSWHLPGRALILGLPLTLGGTALIAHWVAGLTWSESFLLGAILCPTDPVFAAAIVGRKQVSPRLRQLLNVESGLNDGIALPIVVIMLSVVSKVKIGIMPLLGEIVLGVVLGVAIPYAAIRLEKSRFFSSTVVFRPLNVFAIGMLVFATASLLHANLYLAAFAAGITLASASEEMSQAFHQFGELLSEILKFAALLVFGALISPKWLLQIGWRGCLFGILCLILVRPVAIGISLLRSSLTRRETIAAAWFGPKGFASVVFGLMILQVGIANDEELFHLVGVVIAVSILAHSSTDVIMAKWLEQDNDSLIKPAQSSEH